MNLRRFHSAEAVLPHCESWSSLVAQRFSREWVAAGQATSPSRSTDSAERDAGPDGHRATRAAHRPQPVGQGAHHPS